MPEGSIVTASRGSVVMSIEGEFFSSGTSEYYKIKSNNIVILHNDGSMGIYAHLQLNSIKVNQGDKINTGDPIAKSGNTGYSTGPHLHFSVFMNKSNKAESVPFQFFKAANANYKKNII